MTTTIDGEDTAESPDAPEPTAAYARGFAWAGFAGGTVVSVWANIQHARLPPATMPPEVRQWAATHPGFDIAASHQPALAPQLAAAFWPLALLVAVEIMTRVRWPDGRTWRLSRFAGVGLVALGAAVISYSHLYEVLAAWGYTGPSLIAGPLVVDGLMIVSGAALFALAQPPNPVDPAAPDPDEDPDDEQENDATDDPDSSDPLNLSASAKRIAAEQDWAGFLLDHPDADPAHNRRFAETVAQRYGYATRWAYYRRNQVERRTGHGAPPPQPDRHRGSELDGVVPPAHAFEHQST